jgi:hypothetical protein
MKRLLPVSVLILSGCAFWNDADRVGADLDLGLDGILANVAGIHLKAGVAIERKVGYEKNGPAAGGADRGFL